MFPAKFWEVNEALDSDRVSLDLGKVLTVHPSRREHSWLILGGFEPWFPLLLILPKVSL